MHTTELRLTSADRTRLLNEMIRERGESLLAARRAEEEAQATQARKDLIALEADGTALRKMADECDAKRAAMETAWKPYEAARNAFNAASIAHGNAESLLDQRRRELMAKATPPYVVRTLLEVADAVVKRCNDALAGLPPGPLQAGAALERLRIEDLRRQLRAITTGDSEWPADLSAWFASGVTAAREDRAQCIRAYCRKSGDPLPPDVAAEAAEPLAEASSSTTPRKKR